MKLNFANIKSLLMEAAREWSDDKASRLGAALAYYTVFSIAPLLLITIAVAGFVFGDEAARGTVSAQIQSLVGGQAAEAIEGMISSANEKKGTGIFATIISTLLLLFGASGVFVQLKDALNTVWDVPDKETEGGVWGFIKSRFLSFGFVLGVGFLLLASLLVSTILSGMGKFMGGMFPMAWLMQIINIVVSFGVITVLFAMIFKFLPDIKLPWRDVWYGAVITTVLFTIGKWALGLYLGRSSVGSAYGAAGSFVVLLVWIYYSAQIVFYGAEVTQVYSRKYGAWQGREKRTSRQKHEGVKPWAEGTKSGDAAGSAEQDHKETDRAAEIAAASPDHPHPVGKAIGKVAAYVVAGKAVADGLKKQDKQK